MAKHKRPARVARWAEPHPSAPDPRQVGLQAFQAGRFDGAITIWSPLAKQDAAVATALAEAYFRRALLQTAPAARVADLRQGLALAPADPRFEYHLGLTQHRANDLPGAVAHYRAVLSSDRGFPGAALLLALATLEQGPAADLATLPGSTPEVRTALAPIQALLRGKQPDPATDSAIDRLWRGLGLVQQGGGAARPLLEDHRPLDAARATTVRRYYRGVAAAQTGDLDTALKDWQHVADGPSGQPWLWDNLAAALLQKGSEYLTPAWLNSATPLIAHLPQMVAGNTALGEIVVQALDRAAHVAVADNNWAQAVGHWELARQLLGLTSGLGSPRPLLHNLALAYEALERWLDAANTWRAMLRTRPRQSAEKDQPSAETGPNAAQWAWVRKRVIECYKRADMPGEAVAVFRQAIKTDPRDLESRLQLADALIANDQLQAAVNELRRILEIDPGYVDAGLRLAALEHSRGYPDEALRMLRQLYAAHPANQRVRDLLVKLLVEHGEELHNYGSYAAAIAVLEEGRRIAPDDWHFPLHLARIAFEGRRHAEARTLLEQATELAGDHADAYPMIIEIWAALDDHAAARALLAQLETRPSVTPSLYIGMGSVLLRNDGQAPKPRKAKAKAAAPVQNWVQLALELFDRAVALRPDDPRVRLSLVSTLLLKRPDLAMRYAQEAVTLSPEDPDALMQLATAQALNNLTQEAKQTLRNAARLARRQGKPDLARHADELYQEVGTPFFRMSLEMADLFSNYDIDPDDFY